MPDLGAWHSLPGHIGEVLIKEVREVPSRKRDRFFGNVSAERRLTTAAFDSIYPIPAFGPKGDVGVLFRDDRLNGTQHVFFTRLGCVAGN